MVIKVYDVDFEEFCKYLIEKYLIGVIVFNVIDICIVFSCVEKEDILYVFDLIVKVIDDLR